MSRPPPLRVVHVISGLGLGGAETVLYRLITASQPLVSHTVVSMTDDGVFGERLRAAGAQVVCLGMPPGRLTWAGLKRLYRYLRAERPDVVQTWMYHADLIGGVVARLAGIKAVAWGIRNSGVNLAKSSRVARALAWVCGRVSGWVPALIVSCAQDAARRHQSWGYRADRMRVIPNGYDMARWVPNEAARQRLRKEWGFAERTRVIGAVARWNPLKDHANLLSAFAICASGDKSLRCVLVGHGIDSDNKKLMALIDSYQLHEQVLLLGPRDDVPDIMSALDVHVLSSCAEGFPNVVAEAMATGVANVVTDVGDAASIVGADGWVVPPENAPALGIAIGQALAELDTPEMALRRDRGRERMGRLYSLQAMVVAYERTWRELANPAPRLLFVVNNPAFFLSHRLPIALAASEDGFDVHVATMPGPAAGQIEQLGLTHHALPMTRSGKNPVSEIYTLFALWRLFRRLRPDVVHGVTIKPVLYGGIAARLAGVPGYVAAISGLGFVFMQQGGRARVLRAVATWLYRLALGHRNSRVIFQNGNDRDLLLKAGAVRAEHVVLIRGSGVDLDVFKALPEPSDPPVALMASRLLVDKGVREFVEAARLAAGQGGGLRWVLAGGVDPGNPTGISADEVAQWQAEGVIEYVGERTDMAQLYEQCHIAVLPSYREGLPKSLIEAAACGRAVVTTDVPGCRDAITPDVTGLLVPAQDAKALCAAVLCLANDAALRQRMGAAGRALAEQAFDVRQVVSRHLEIYRDLLKGLER